MYKSKIVAFYYSVKNPENSIELSFEEQKNKVESKYTSSEVVNSFYVKNQRNFLNKFKIAVYESLQLEAKLVIGYFAPFQKKIKALELLQDKKVDFEFIDLNCLKTGAALNCLIKYIRYTKEIKGTKIRAKIGERKAKGEKQGAENLQKETIVTNISKANYYRRFNSLYVLETRNARNIIRSLRNQNLSYQRIAIRLNEEGIQTPKDSKFSSKTVERYYKFDLKRIEREQDYDFLEIKSSSFMKNSKKKNKFNIKGILPHTNIIGDYLEFLIVSNLKNKQPLKFNIYNNREKTPIYSNLVSNLEVVKTSIKSGNRELDIKVNLKSLQILLPGLHYLEIKDETSNYGQIVPFYFYAENPPKLPESFE